MSKLPRDFYTSTDVVQVARDLLGKGLYTKIDGKVSAVMFGESEA